MNVSSSQRARRLSIFSRRKKNALPIDVSPGLVESSDSSESSLELIELDMTNHIGELKMNLKESDTLIGTNANNSDSDDRIKEIILKYKGRRAPLSDAPTPRKPYRCNSFKMDGVPAFMNKEIERKARKDAEKRQKRQQAKSKAAIDQLHESFSSLYEDIPRMIQRKHAQRPKATFLDFPKGHPLCWDPAEFLASDFPEKDRAFLAKLFKNPQMVVRGKRLPTRVELTLRKMQLFDWDIATIGRCATMLFDPETNPLNLTPATNKYFFNRFDSLKTELLEGSEVLYRGEPYKQGDAMEDLFERLRRDFEDAIRTDQVNHDDSLPF